MSSGMRKDSAVVLAIFAQVHTFPLVSVESLCVNVCGRARCFHHLPGLTQGNGVTYAQGCQNHYHI